MGLKNETALDTVINLWKHFDNQEWDKAKSLLSDDFKATWPQSKEKIISPNNFIEMNRTYPGSHKIEVLGTQHSYDVWEHVDEVTTQVFIQSKMPDGKKMELYGVSFFRIMDEKIISATEFWADTYPAPEWRKQYVETYN